MVSTRLILVVGLALSLIGFSLGVFVSNIQPPLPPEFVEMINRFRFVNRSTNDTLYVYKTLGRAETRFEGGTVILESYVIGFEDRFGRAEADNDFLDLLVELKWVKGGDSITVRVVQLGLDRVDVYLDDTYIGVAEPSIQRAVKILR